MSDDLRAPFPWFGGKRRVAPEVWARFGDVPNYVEPFAGSLAVLLGRPHAPRTETVNDRDCYLSNFWRALQADSDAVAHYADWPVNEADLHARHRWLVAQGEFRERMTRDPEFYDVQIAGWWVWGLCAWIGSGWCSAATTGGAATELPHLGDAGQGLHRKLPHLGDAGRGELRAPRGADGGPNTPAQLPHLGNAGRGAESPAPAVQLPHFGDGGRGVHRARPELMAYLGKLAARLRRVRVACGDWSRVLGDSVTWRHGTTAVFLDPPYGDEEHAITYAGGGSVAENVRAWALANGHNPALRIALCGYEGEHEMPDSWAVHVWKARGGYGSQGSGRGRENARRERIWFSPHCLRPEAILDLFGRAGGESE